MLNLIAHEDLCKYIIDDIIRQNITKIKDSEFEVKTITKLTDILLEHGYTNKKSTDCMPEFLISYLIASLKERTLASSINVIYDKNTELFTISLFYDIKYVHA